MFNHVNESSAIHHFTYDAKNPYLKNSSWLEWFKNLSLGNEFIGTLVLPAQSFRFSDDTDDDLEKMSRIHQVKIHPGFIKTHDHALLDTIQITPDDLDTSDIFEQYFIIKFLGNGMQHNELFSRFVDDAHELKCTVIGFDYRNVGSSQKAPRKFQDLVTDGIAQVNRLLDFGADPSKIVLDGISLGGAVATMVAKYCHDHQLRVYLWNDRSFASVSKAAAGLASPEWPTLFGGLLFTSLEAPTWSTMKPLGWEENVAKAYLEIPEKYKNYMVVARKSAKSCGDGVIHHQASLHHAIKETERMHVKTGHKVFAIGYFGHNMRRVNLTSKADPSKNGQQLFEEFVLNARLKK